MKVGIGRPSPAMVVALIALIAALSGSAYAAIARNSVGTRQLKASSVTTGKIANNAINGAKVADGSLTGTDINLGALGTVPSATSAQSAGNADTVDGHSVSCPAGTILIRGICFDSTSNPEAPTLQAATEGCAARGGWLPTPMELYSIRSIVNLGTGIGVNHQYTDTYYNGPGTSAYRTIVIDGTGALKELEPNQPSRYVCAYPLVR